MISITELSEYIGIVTPQIWEDCFQEAMEGYDSLWLQGTDFPVNYVGAIHESPAGHS